MPFEFTGETPSLGSTSNAFKPFSFASSSTATPLQPPSFGASPVFGSTSAGSGPPPISGITSRPSQSTTPAKSGAEDGENKPLQAALAKLSLRDDTLTRALHRASTGRSAFFGDAAIAADRLVEGYLELACKDKGGEKATHIENLVYKLADSPPETLDFLRYVIDAATHHKATKPLVPDQPQDLRLESPRSPGIPPEDEDDAIGSAPDYYKDINIGTALYRACGAEVSSIILANTYHHYNSYDDLAPDVLDLIAGGARRAEVRQFLASGANGIFTPSSNTLRDVDKLIDDLYDGIMYVKREFKAGWTIKGKDETSYFRQKPKGEPRQHMVPRHWSEDQPTTEDGASTYCCGPVQVRGAKTITFVNTDEEPFRFMDLPPELRSHVYRYLLAPGIVRLFSCAHKNPQGTGKRLQTKILRASKQVHKEAASLIFENEFHVTLWPADYVHTFAPEALNKVQLPRHALKNIKMLFIVIDCIEFKDIHCEWAPLQALTALRTLRITVIEEEKFEVPFHRLTDLLTEICMRVPSECLVQYGCDTPDQSNFTNHMMRVLKNKELWRKTDRPIEAVRAVDADDLREASKDIPDQIRQGVKSGEKSKSRTLPGDFRDLPGMGNLNDSGKI